ncbi:hypothetical protein L211DRAFT_867135 [Terfezia boudieri ATCC MYA-4762]|uniref:Uncharacterized protein n=1 Tax=Terfezia boudieri ATCC MYA-4762 TaxID=1051890 RepID=A0A3N4LVC6_9PEZI|nr:hypothetical protein L211DRAFT_867135 [Terfezia boudieri ATCC MYA-4762]
MEGRHCNSLLLPNGSSSQYDDSWLDLSNQHIEMDLGEANLSETNIDIEDVRPGPREWEPKPPFQAAGRENGYDLYPTLPPWGHNNKFSYDKWGQLSAQIKFEKADLQEYLYNHPLKDSLIIWIQRQPIDAVNLYQTHYGASCRYRKCRPKKGNPHAIATGHYRIAIDELSGRYANHKADTYIHAAIFHISCFEGMLDLAQVARDFTVQCEHRKFVNAPNGEKPILKNRMLLEPRRVPHAVTKWLERAKEDPNWTTTSVENGMNYLVFTQKFSLRPHRRKCTDVPGMEKLDRDISYLGAARPVAPNSIWGGKRVKGMTVAELAAREGREYRGPEKSKKRARSCVEEEAADHPPPVRRARLNSRAGDEKDPTVLESPGPVKFQKPGRLRNEPCKQKAQRQRGTALEPPIQQMPTIPTKVRQEPAAKRRGSQLPDNILNASALPPGTIIRTAGGEYLRNPVTGMLEPILSVTVMDSYKYALETPGPSNPQTAGQYIAPTAQLGYIPTDPMIQTPLIDPALRAPAEEYRTISGQVEEEKGEEPINDCNKSLFGDSPPLSAPAQLEYKLDSLGNLDISQYQFSDVQLQGIKYAQAPAPEDPAEFDISHYQLDDAQPQGMDQGYAQVSTQTVTETMALEKSLFMDFLNADMDSFNFDWLQKPIPGLLLNEQPL